MTTQEQIKALAELDGWKQVTRSCCEWVVTDYNGNGEYQHKDKVGFERDGVFKFLNNLPNYLTSYDAILPLIQKQPLEVKDFIARSFVFLPNTFPCNRDVIKMLMATPAQLCEALLRATGKWKE